MSERDRKLLLEDMLEAALKIKRYTHVTDEGVALIMLLLEFLLLDFIEG